MDHTFRTLKPFIDINTGDIKSGGPEKPIRIVGSAGVVPFDIIDSEIQFLLGYDPNDRLWKCFGGGKEKSDTGPREIAHREVMEEACTEDSKKCYLDQSILSKLKKGDGVCIPKAYKDKYNNTIWNNFYFIQMDKQRWVKKFAQDKTDEINVSKIKRNEVTKMKWFDIKTIFNDQEKFKLHPPLYAIIRDHYKELLKLLISTQKQGKTIRGGSNLFEKLLLVKKEKQINEHITKILLI